MDINQFEIVEKGWTIPLNKIDSGYEYSEHACTAVNRNEAKVKLMKDYTVQEMVLLFGGQVTYLTLPVIRCKDYDLLNYNGKPTPRSAVVWELQKEEHNAKLKMILHDENITHCYIRKRGTYYRENHCGYTELKLYAGVYPKEEAVKTGLNTVEIHIVPINNQEHNSYLLTEIENIKSRLIN